MMVIMQLIQSYCKTLLLYASDGKITHEYRTYVIGKTTYVRSHLGFVHGRAACGPVGL